MRSTCRGCSSLTAPYPRTTYRATYCATSCATCRATSCVQGVPWSPIPYSDNVEIISAIENRSASPNPNPTLTLILIRTRTRTLTRTLTQTLTLTLTLTLTSTNGLYALLDSACRTGNSTGQKFCASIHEAHTDQQSKVLGADDRSPSPNRDPHPRLAIA